MQTEHARRHMRARNVRRAQSEQGLAKSRSLTSLDLSGNLLGKNTCWELKISLMKNRTLRTLNLECNQVPIKKALGVIKRVACGRVSVTRD